MSIPCQGFAYIGAKTKVSRWVHRQSNIMCTVSNEKDHRKKFAFAFFFFLSIDEPLGLFTPGESGSENEKDERKVKKFTEK